MRIRTQLILAFLVLSVMPLSGIVLYSYLSSQRTLRQAVEADAAAMTREMDARMAAIRDDLGRGLVRLGELPVDTLMDAAGSDRGPRTGQNDLVASRVLGAMGNAAPLVESIAFTPDDWTGAGNRVDAGARPAAVGARNGAGTAQPAGQPGTPEGPSASRGGSPANPAGAGSRPAVPVEQDGRHALPPAGRDRAHAAPGADRFADRFAGHPGSPARMSRPPGPSGPPGQIGAPPSRPPSAMAAAAPAAPPPPAAPAVPAPAPLASAPAPAAPAATAAAGAAIPRTFPGGPGWKPAPTVIIPLRKILIHYRASAAEGAEAGGVAVDDSTRQVDVEQLVEQALTQAEAAQAGATRQQQEAIAKWMEKRHWPLGSRRQGVPGAVGREPGRQRRGAVPDEGRGKPSAPGSPGSPNAPGSQPTAGSAAAGLSPQEIQELEDLGASMGEAAVPAAPAGPSAKVPAAPGHGEAGPIGEASLAEDLKSALGDEERAPAEGTRASRDKARGSALTARGAQEAGRMAKDAARGAREVERRKKEVVRGTREAARGAAGSTLAAAEASRRSTAAERRDAEAAAGRVLAQQREQLMVLGDRLAAPVRQGDRVVGHVTAQVSCPTVLRAVLARSRRDAGEIPFALNSTGQLYAIDKADEEKLSQMSLASLLREGRPQQAHRISAAGDDWVVVTQREPATGLILGIARPIGRPLHQVAQTAGRNFGYGLSLIAIALVGILPLSRGMTRNLKVVTDGAQRIAQGDLATRVPVRSRSEFGQLARAFNRMAEDLTDNQQQLIERELEQRLLRREYDRKTAELEEARRFQLALLPKTLPEHPDFAIAVSMRTATEVGGDYYDFHLDAAGDDGILTVAIGDATGHGAKAGTMVTAIKGLLSADFAKDSLSGFLGDAARAVRRMDLERMAMALALARLSPGALTVSSAGMPPVLVYRRKTGEVEEIALSGMPLGGMPCDYHEHRVGVEEGDAVLLTTDGLPELANAEGDPLGYPRVRSLLAECGAKSPEEIVASLTAAAEAWTGGQPPKDDMTLVVVQVRRDGAAG